MRSDLERLPHATRPLVGGVEQASGSETGARSEARERDEEIIRMLRSKLQERGPGAQAAFPSITRDGKPAPGEEDKYEPQRINRKICWQYDSNAKKVPLLRRHYI
jgi:hypothetical protein